MSRADCENFLNRWISNYVLASDTGTQADKAKYPLRDARIDVFEVRGKPGAYRAVAYLRPHFQLDELTASLRLVAELPQPVKQ
jgi:type VI secretion system protein ImpC